MAWTAPRTWVTSEVVTASHMNTHVRDNFLVTGPGVAANAGRILVVTGSNAIDERLVDGAIVSTSQTTTSTSYTDLTTTGPTVTGTTGTRALVWVGAQMSNSGAGNLCLMSFAVSGATTTSAADGSSIIMESDAANQVGSFGSPPIEVTLTSGTNTFTAKYRVDAGTGTFFRRRIAVLCL